ncbi:MAG: sensor histidine kinase, partial [Bacillota bacterium]
MRVGQAIAIGLGITLLETLFLLAGFNSNLWLTGGFLATINGVGAYIALDYAARRRVVTVRLDDQPVDPTLQIANETLPVLRRGLNEETARKTAEIIQKIS